MGFFGQFLSFDLLDIKKMYKQKVLFTMHF